VRAVVRELSDEQLVVSQGQEINSRTDLVGKIFRGLSASRSWWCVSTTMVLFLEQLS
jgi:hypothetical protein